MPSVESAKNTDNSDVLQNMEFDAEPPIEEIDREALINEVLDESKNLIDEIKKISDKSGETEQSKVTSVELESIEAELIGRVKKITDTVSENKDNEAESEEQPVEDYEKLQKPFEEFDELEKISEEDADILIKNYLSCLEVKGIEYFHSFYLHDGVRLHNIQATHICSHNTSVWNSFNIAFGRIQLREVTLQ